MPRRLLVLTLLLSLLTPLALASASPAAAHAYLERAEPPPDAVLPAGGGPRELRLWFTETVEPSFTEVQLVDPQRQPVASGPLQISADRQSATLPLPALADGSYTVVWKNVSTVDGHAARGFFTLTVGQPSANPTVDPVSLPADEGGPPLAVKAAARWLTFAAQALAVGGLLFGPLVLLPALAAGGTTLGAGAARRRWLLEGVGLAALALAALLALLIQTLVATEAPLAQALGAPLLLVLTGTRYGLVWGGRVVILLLLVAFWLWAGRRAARPAAATWAGAALGLALLLTTSATSHGAAVRDGAALAVAADWLHLVATAAWVGGLAHLALLVPAALADSPAPRRPAVRRALIGRFSTLSLAAVAMLLLTGAYSGLLHIDRLDALWTTDYGRALATKLLLLLPMLGLGAINLLRLRPALAAAVSATGRRTARLAEAGEAAWRSLRRSVRAELLLGVLILLATGALTSVAPARQPVVTAGYSATETVGDLRLTLRVAPALPGDNTLELEVSQGGRPVDDATRALLRLTYLDQNLGESEVVLAPAGGGRYTAQSRQLGVIGQWQAEMIVRRDGQQDARTAVRFAIPSTAGGAAAPDAPALGSGPLRPVGLAALAAAAALVVAGLRLRRQPTLSSVLLGGGAGGLALGLGLLVLAALTPTPGPAAPTAYNPFPSTPQSREIGLTVYTANCQICHGATGQGDGPGAAGLTNPALNLTTHLGAHPDAEVYRIISQGVRGTAMPAWAGRLTEEERWHVLNYIRTFDASQTGQIVPSFTAEPTVAD